MEKEKTKKEGIVEVSESYLKELSRELKQLQEDRDMLIAIADKKGLAKWQGSHAKDRPYEIKIRRIDGKTIIEWKTTKDVVEYDRVTKRGFEDQRLEVLFEDGTKQEYTLVDFNRRFDYVICKRIGQIVNEQTGEVALKLVRTDNGKEIIIGVQYVN